MGPARPVAVSSIVANRRRHGSFTRLVAVVLAGTFPSACMTWRTQPLQAERFPSADDKQTIRLTLTSGDTMTVRAPVITGDSLIGLRSQPGFPDSLYRISVPLAGIRRAEVKESAAQFDVGAEPGALVVIALAAVAVVALLVALVKPWPG